MTNQEMADRLGIHFSMASRLRAGKRLPSTDLLRRIHKEFRIPLKDLVAAHEQGPKAFGKLIRERIFKESVAA